MPLSSAFRLAFSSSSFAASFAALSRSVSISRLTAASASSMRLAAFSRGAILKPKSPALTSCNFVWDTEQSAFIPSGHLPRRISLTASAANTRFSPVSGTISATVAMPASGMYSLAPSRPSNASATLQASPAPHICRFGYSSALLQSISASHLGSVSPGI